MAAAKKFSATQAEIDAAERQIDWLIPWQHKKHLRPEEVAECIGYGVDFVRQLVQQGELETLSASAFGSRESNRITRRSVLVWVCRKSNYDTEQIIRWIIEVGATLSAAARIRLANALITLNSKQPNTRQ